MQDLLSLTPEELTEVLTSMGEPKYRATQVFSALHKGMLPVEMTTLPLSLREKLSFSPPILETKQISSDGTCKMLWRLSDGETVESVLMNYRAEHSLCISTQVGCNMGCAFCASTMGGKVRDLTSGEMLAQIIYCGENISSLVLMGIGEPLDNLDNVLKFLDILRHPAGRNMSLRHVTISTSGLVSGINRLAELELPITLSVSLHAPDDETRSRLMPVNKKYPINELMRACKNFFAKTGRRTSYEYVMIDGVNDTPEHAMRLKRLLTSQSAHVNLISYNPVEGKPYKSSSQDVIRRFQGAVTTPNITVTVRRKLGNDIDAACGQLRRKAVIVKL